LLGLFKTDFLQEKKKIKENWKWKPPLPVEKSTEKPIVVANELGLIFSFYQYALMRSL